ncbi:Hypothetical protein ORPV_524 [Orpheovirus IHUMI-LCC2]|uniref:F-box domain-containing protein n=1 Tax=Orpheovirus IHUMI-LCC2 TaxID=2023057 RepID=A0A2I2L4H0_9VIRU|nr:Hypothetical protein ORPV_524 [Orpheovirus IHUMI-LCC2]SNW62428.1 Hypothetical protein ORPV_524 [Orpheovirus IHUMI-LCC2]
MELYNDIYKLILSHSSEDDLIHFKLVSKFFNHTIHNMIVVCNDLTDILVHKKYLSLNLWYNNEIKKMNLIENSKNRILSKCNNLYNDYDITKNKKYNIMNSWYGKQLEHLRRKIFINSCGGNIYMFNKYFSCIYDISEDTLIECLILSIKYRNHYIFTRLLNIIKQICFNKYSIIEICSNAFHYNFGWEDIMFLYDIDIQTLYNTCISSDIKACYYIYKNYKDKLEISKTEIIINCITQGKHNYIDKYWKKEIEGLNDINEDEWNINEYEFYRIFRHYNQEESINICQQYNIPHTIEDELPNYTRYLDRNNIISPSVRNEVTDNRGIFNGNDQALMIETISYISDTLDNICECTNTCHCLQRTLNVISDTENFGNVPKSSFIIPYRNR